jgi:beta-RFAP synthase
MAVALALSHLAGRQNASAEELATLVGRGERSAIGAHGFFHGGFIVEGGKSESATLSPMLMRLRFPDAWRIVVIRPRTLEGLAGQRERIAFSMMPSIPREVTAEMCRLVLLGLAPTLIEQDLDRFGVALYELQQTVGACFATAQGGVYADPLLQDIVSFIVAQGVRGVGQSSWGPTLYAVLPDEDSAEKLALLVESRFDLHGVGEVFVTAADNDGASIRRIESVERSNG